MKLHTYQSPEHYRRVQEEWNRRKLSWVYVAEKELDIIAKTLKPIGPRFGICHGARNGHEVAGLHSRLPDCRVIGTDISSTATDFKNVIQHDFHNPMPDGCGPACFVYSNSLDHAHDPQKAIAAWKAQLRIGGLLIVHWSVDSEEAYMTEADCFGASLEEYRSLIKPDREIRDGMTRLGCLLIWERLGDD